MKKRNTMLNTTTFRKVLLIGLLTFLIAIQAGKVSAETNVWTSNGPDGGRINALTIDPTTPGKLYAGTYGGGVFAISIVGPGSFSKTSPANGATNQPSNLSLSWGASSDATYYQYCIDTTNNNTCNTTWISTGSNTSVPLSSLTPGTYYWAVRARNATGITVANKGSTPWWSFNTIPLPGAFSKTSPVNGATNQPSNPTLSWGTSSNAAYYQYCIDTTASCITPAAWISTGTNTSVDLSGLTPGVKYYWQVRAKNATGITFADGGNATWFSFTTHPTTYPLSVSKTGTGSAAVTSSPEGIDCGSTCSYDFNYNSDVTLTATPSTGSIFTGWSGACTGTDTCEVTMSTNRSVTATFVFSPAVMLVVADYPSLTTAGTEHDFTVTAKDAYGKTAIGYTGTVHFTSSDVQAMLPDDTAFVPGDNGTKIFTATLKTGESDQSITATDTVTGMITGSQSGIEITPAEASMLLVSDFPSPTTAGADHDFTVTAKDTYGNTASDYIGTVHFTSSDTLAVLPDDYTFVSDDNGAKTFTATLTFYPALMESCGRLSITATDTVNGSITGSQSGILVTPEVASTGHIAFTSLRDGNWEIYVMNSDGSYPVRLTCESGWDIDPSWSPDGKKIAFSADRGGGLGIYVMNADGSNQPIRLTYNGDESYPTWSPDGTKIAFTEGIRSGNGTYDIWVMNSSDGSHKKNLTSGYPGHHNYPAWSPDGEKIAFSTSRDGQWEIYTMNAVDGSDPVNLTNNYADDAFEAWSPDGSKIAFDSYRDGNWEVYVMNADGTNPTRLTYNPAEDGYVYSWSPDGTKILFSSRRNGPYELYVINADRPEHNPPDEPDYPLRLTYGTTDEFGVWSPY
jgi:Tol biopolymer transport system component